MRFLSVLPLVLSPLTAQQLFAELTRHHLPATPPPAATLATIDLEGDGDLDLLAGNANGPSAIWVNDGKGHFADTGNHSGLAANIPTTAFAVGDVNGDGQQDVVVATLYSGLRLLLGSAGALWPAPFGSTPPTLATIQAVGLFDADGDGDLDLVYAESAGAFALDRLWLNDGAGHFTGPTFGIGSPGSNQFVPFDCDGDGDRDLLCVSWNAPPRLLLNQASTFVPAPLPASVTTGWCATTGDVDGDGDADIVIGNNQWSNPALRQDRLLRNNGAGVFTDVTATAMPPLDNWTSAVHLADVDGDGDLDLVVAHQQVLMILGNRLGHSLLRNDGTGTFSDVSTTLPNNDHTTSASVMFDVDGDGDRDYVFAGGGSHQLYWNDSGTLIDAAGPTLPPRFAMTEGVAAGDLDGDGLPEVIAAGWNFQILGGRTSLLWNDGTGHFAELATNPAFPNGIYSSAAVGDIDGDSDLDLVFGLDQPGQNRVYRNIGSHLFTDITSTALPAGADYTRVVRLFDADGDGDLDLLFGNTDNSRLLQNNGTGTFTEITSTALPPSSNTRDVAIGDVDGDGDLDIVRGTDTAANELWRNTGGVFQPSSASMPSIVQATEAVALADLDGDQDLDLIVGNRPQATLDPRSWIHWNDGTGTFTSAPVPLGSIDVRAIAIGDIEQDGDVDFVLGGRNTAPRLFENLGGVAFVSQPGRLPADPRYTTRLVLVDVDGDGDLDLFEGDEQRNRVLQNLHRQLQSRRLFVPGTTVPLEAFVGAGAPGQLPAAVVLLGLPGMPVATPFGIARLDLTSIVPVGFGVVTPPQTSITSLVSIPANPALLGAVIGAQLLALHDAASWRLSGLVRETVRQ